MKSQLTPDFVTCFAQLPDSVKEQARQCYKKWCADPTHPSLHFKKIKGKKGLYSVRVALGWRALGLLSGDTITWFWIGSHADYDKLIG